MNEKLVQCIKMLKFLGEPKIRLKPQFGQFLIPLTREQQRSTVTFHLKSDGTVDYYGEDEGYLIPRRARQAIHIEKLAPTIQVIDLAFKKLRIRCIERSKELVMQRLIDHQLKYGGLDFLIDAGQIDQNPHLH